MELRTLGRTGLRVSALGFGAGAVGGLMTRGAAADQERAVARALELGINYFDTAPIYGDGESEKNLGRVWKTLRPAAAVGTKVRLAPEERSRIGAAITAFFLLLVVLKMTLGVSLGIALVPLQTGPRARAQDVGALFRSLKLRRWEGLGENHTTHNLGGMSTPR